MAIGAVIVRARREAGLTQSDLAARLGVDQRTVSRLEAGRRPYVDQVLAIDAACGRPAGWILRSAGLIDEISGETAEAAIDQDPLLTEHWRALVLASYRAAASGSADEVRSSASKAAVGIGAAIRRLRAPRTQTDVAALLNEKQSTISRWEKGGLFPSIADITRFEQALGLPAGSVFAAAGLIEVADAEAALLADPALDELQRGAVIEFYRIASARSEARN